MHVSIIYLTMPPKRSCPAGSLVEEQFDMSTNNMRCPCRAFARSDVRQQLTSTCPSLCASSAFRLVERKEHQRSAIKELNLRCKVSGCPKLISILSWCPKNCLHQRHWRSRRVVVALKIIYAATGHLVSLHQRKQCHMLTGAMLANKLAPMSSKCKPRIQRRLPSFKKVTPTRIPRSRSSAWRPERVFLVTSEASTLTTIISWTWNLSSEAELLLRVTLEDSIFRYLKTKLQLSKKKCSKRPTTRAYSLINCLRRIRMSLQLSHNVIARYESVQRNWQT